MILDENIFEPNEGLEKTSKGEWVNKGKEGTHGKFKTKKAARQQQKAMFAQGYKENLGTYKVVDKNGKKVPQGGGFTSKKEAQMFAAQYGEKDLKVVKESIEENKNKLNISNSKMKLTRQEFNETLTDSNDTEPDIQWLIRNYNVDIEVKDHEVIISGLRSDIERLYNDYNLEDYSIVINDSIQEAFNIHDPDRAVFRFRVTLEDEDGKYSEIIERPFRWYQEIKRDLQTYGGTWEEEFQRDFDDTVVKVDLLGYKDDIIDMTGGIRESYSESKPEDYDSIKGPIEYPNGTVLYFDRKGNKLIAGEATNAGIIPEYEYEIDYHFSVDWNIQNFYEIIELESPELYNVSENKNMKKINKRKKLTESVSFWNWYEEVARDKGGLLTPISNEIDDMMQEGDDEDCIIQKDLPRLKKLANEFRYCLYEPRREQYVYAIANGQIYFSDRRRVYMNKEDAEYFAKNYNLRIEEEYISFEDLCIKENDINESKRITEKKTSSSLPTLIYDELEKVGYHHIYANAYGYGYYIKSRNPKSFNRAIQVLDKYDVEHEIKESRGRYFLYIYFKPENVAENLNYLREDVSKEEIQKLAKKHNVKVMFLDDEGKNMWVFDNNDKESVKKFYDEYISKYRDKKKNKQKTEESLKNNEINEFAKLVKKIGIENLGGLARFIKDHKDQDLLKSLKDYLKELGDDFEIKNESKNSKTKEVAVLQGYYEGHWEDLLEYEMDDMSRKQDLKDYNENEQGITHRIIYRRVPKSQEELKSTKSIKEEYEEDKFIILDAPPGGVRPNEILVNILRGTGIEPVKPSSTFFGEWTFNFNHVDDEKWFANWNLIWDRMVKEYNTGNLRYASISENRNKMNESCEVGVSSNNPRKKKTIQFFDDDSDIIGEDLENNDMLNKAYHGSYYTITGAGGDLQEWKDGYQELLDKENIGKIKEWITFSGRDMNTKYNLKGDNAYPNDLTFLAFPLDGLDIGKLSIFKLKMKDRWFDDIVDNNARREGYDDLDESIENNSLDKEQKNIQKEDYEVIEDNESNQSRAGIASTINDLIRDEFETIDRYNSAIVTVELENRDDIAQVLKDIVNEENIHIGQLEKCLTLVSSDANSIETGKQEAEEQLSPYETQENI